jgi:hypothetical protein
MLVWIYGVASANPHVQPHSLCWVRVYAIHGCCPVHAGGLRVGVHCPILRNVVPDDEHGRFVRRILHNVFLLVNLDKETGTLTLRDLRFDMVRRQHALKMTNGVVAEGIKVVAENQRGGSIIGLPGLGSAPTPQAA